MYTHFLTPRSPEVMEVSDDHYLSYQTLLFPLLLAFPAHHLRSCQANESGQVGTIPCTPPVPCSYKKL